MARVALVTGGTRGIGAAISKALKAAGCKVAASYAGNDAAAEKFKSETGIPVYKWDVSSFDACTAGIKKVEADLGPVDILVNNAGITGDALAVRMSDEDWLSVLDLNLTAAFRLTRALLRGMIRRRHGRIIGVASVVAVSGNAGQANYTAAKAAMIGMSKSIAAEVAGRGITVNCVAPGLIATAMTEKLTVEQRARLAAAIPAGRVGVPEDVATAVAFLAGPEAAYITGQTLHINGGMVMV
jgi:acetoacetyl-CoA reductase